jgi:hypothetical protein
MVQSKVFKPALKTLLLRLLGSQVLDSVNRAVFILRLTEARPRLPFRHPLCLKIAVLGLTSTATAKAYITSHDTGC